MKFPICVYRLESPGWCICRNAASLFPKKRVHPKDCQECQVRVETGKVLIPVVKRVPNDIPPETPQEAHMALPEITPLGLLIFTRTQWEPPPQPPGYHRADTEAAWVLEPDVPMCKHLELGSGPLGACGYPRLTRRCKLVQSFVGPTTCESCKKRDSDAG